MSESYEAPFGRPDKVGHRRITFAHLRQDFLGRDAPVHHPDAVRLSVLGLDFF